MKDKIKKELSYQKKYDIAKEQFEEMLNGYKEFLSDLVSEDKSGHHLTKEWYRLLKKGIWDSNCSIAPKSFHRCIQWISMKTDRDEFLGYDHKDVHSFIHSGFI